MYFIYHCHSKYYSWKWNKSTIFYTVMQVHTCIMYMHASYYSMLYSNINTLKISDMTAWKLIKLFQIQYKRKPYFQKLSEAYILVASIWNHFDQTLLWISFRSKRQRINSARFFFLSKLKCIRKIDCDVERLIKILRCHLISMIISKCSLLDHMVVSNRNSQIS